MTKGTIEDKPRNPPIAVDRDFATLVGDGVYAHHLDSFISLVFYRDEVMPAYDDKGFKNTWTRLLLFEIRLPRIAMENLVDAYQSTEKTRSAMRLFDGTSDPVWTETGTGEAALSEPASTPLDREEYMDEDEQIMTAFRKLVERTSMEGVPKLMSVLAGAIHENIDKLELIANTYPKK